MNQPKFFPYLQINNKDIPLSEINDFPPSSTFEKNTIQFIREWLSRQASFALETSGSTGRPKPIRIQRKQMEASARVTVETLGLKSGQTALVCLDTKYIAGKMMLVRALVHQMNILAVNPSSNPLMELKYQPDFAALVPLQLETILSDEKSKAVLNKMKVVIIGGASVSRGLEIRLQHIQVPIYATYGMTETVSHIALKKLNQPNRSGSFTAFEEVELGLDERGCLTIRSVLTDHQRIITNDRVLLHDNRHFEWLGRIDHVINTGGVKVQSEKVERALEKILAVKGINNRFFVTGLPDDKLGEKVVLIIESPTVLVDEQIMLKELSQALNRFEKPKTVFYVSKFIETPNGKINRGETVKVLLSE